MPDRLNPPTIQISSHDAGCVQVRMNRKISIPTPDSDREMAIRCADWKMLERRLVIASDPPKDYSSMYWFLFGLSGSAGFSLIPLAATKDLSAWVLPSFGALTVVFLLCGIFAAFLTRDLRRTRKTIMTTLLDDVKEIGARFTFEPTQSQGNVDPTVVELPNRAIS